MQLSKPSNTRLLSSEKSKKMKIDSPVAITCATDSNPPPHIYTFYEDGVMIQKGESASFNIPQLSYRDQGSYTCVPKNAAGTGLSAVFNLTIEGKLER